MANLSKNFRKTTIENFDGSYRVILNAPGKEVRIQNIANGPIELFGSIADRLGRYERIHIEPDELFNLLKSKGLLPKQALEEESIRRSAVSVIFRKDG